MLKLILSSAAMACFVMAGFGQATLTFNSVKIIEATPMTVQPGKVWKVESVIGPHTEGTSFNGTVAPGFPAAHNITINGQTIGLGVMESSLAFISGSTGSRVTHMARSTVTTLPIWLPEGYSLAAGSNVNFISVIEFDIVP